MPASSPEEIIVFHKSSVESTCRSHTFFLLGSGACPRYNLSVPEGSSGRVEINLPKKASRLCKMPTTITASDTACDPILVFTSKGKWNYYSRTYQGRIALSGWLLVSVKNASEWMAGEYRVVSDLHEICMARINLTVPGPVLFPPLISETPAVREGTANRTGEGSRRGMLSNGSLEGGSPPGLDGYKVAVGVLGAVCVLLVSAVIAQSVWGGAGCELCPKDWRAHRGKCYWDSRRSRIWSESRKDCESRNSQMLVIRDQEEMIIPLGCSLLSPDFLPSPLAAPARSNPTDLHKMLPAAAELPASPNPPNPD
ncbi:Killer cell lectin-like receptor subfamily B member 1B allele B [Chelonia mydas]|uniref:Killer cell lectin-like receptor subfamily B member 1B allele B n=1 Tax=Chelonia mydas TaxID=8469 RepID=M7AXQ7_CHEMY|nr:Killer cell lectin-like receptor subfamily B member 1B allele B [Chelonia mydas]